MKKYLIILSAVLLFTGCSSNDKEPTQEYTSFIIWHDRDITPYNTLFNVISAWKDSDGVFHKIAEHGDLLKNVKSSEFKMDEFHSPIYFFCIPYLGTEYSMVQKTFAIKENRLNTLLVVGEDVPVVTVPNVNDPRQFPQD